MSKKTSKRKFAKKIPQLVATLIVLAIFAFPIFATGRWVQGAVFGNDPRKVLKAEPFNARAIDASDKPLSPFNEPIVSISFDDGWETAYSAALPIMQRYGIRSTQFVLGDEFHNIAYLSEAQVKDMQKQGHEIGSHSMSHPDLTSLDDEDLAWEVNKSKEILNKKLNTSVVDFASPLGAQNATTIDAIKKQYRSQRNTASDPATVGDEDINTKENFNRYNIIAYTVRASTTPRDIQTLLDYTKARNGWLVLTYHQVEDSTSYYAVPKSIFEEHMRMVSQSSLRSAPMGQTLTAIEQQGVVKW